MAVEKHILDTTEWTAPRTTDSLPEFLEKFAAPRRKKRGEKGRTLSDAPKVNGSPHTLVIAGAGLRAADLTRVLRVFQTKESMVQKLFAKHVKLKEALVEVKGTRMGVGVGTPQRIFDLLEDGEGCKFERVTREPADSNQSQAHWHQRHWRESWWTLPILTRRSAGSWT